MDGQPQTSPACGVADLRLDDFAKGQTFCEERCVTEDSVDQFAALSGDHSPLHMDADFARSRGFRTRVAHGLLVGSYISEIIGMHFPGQNSLILTMTLNFREPTYIDDRIRISLEVGHISSGTATIQLKADIERAGTAELLVSGKVLIGMTAPSACAVDDIDAMAAQRNIP